MPAFDASIFILAGGLGSRLGDLTKNRPKPLVNVAGKPFIYYPLLELAKQGIDDVVIGVGHLGHMFEEELGDGSDLGISITYISEGDSPIGTAAAIHNALPKLKDDFVVMYADSLLNMNFLDFYNKYISIGRAPLLAVLRNENRWDASNVAMKGDRVKEYSQHGRHNTLSWIDYGACILNREEMNNYRDSNDLAEVFRLLAIEERLYGYVVEERFYEIGTPTSLQEAAEFIAHKYCT